MASFVRIHEPAAQSFDDPGMPVWDMMNNLGRTIEFLAKENVNSRTGSLRRNIRANRPKPHGIWKSSVTVYANIRHATWVHEGTGTITPKTGKYLTVPKEDYSGGPTNPSGGDLRRAHKRGDPRLFFLAKSISGQDANPYLDNAKRDAIRSSPYID